MDYACVSFACSVRLSWLLVMFRVSLVLYRVRWTWGCPAGLRCWEQASVALFRKTIVWVTLKCFVGQESASKQFRGNITVIHFFLFVMDLAPSGSWQKTAWYVWNLFSYFMHSICRPVVEGFWHQHGSRLFRLDIMLNKLWNQSITAVLFFTFVFQLKRKGLVWTYTLYSLIP